MTTLVLLPETPAPPTTDREAALRRWQERLQPWLDQMPPGLDWSHWMVAGPLLARMSQEDWDHSTMWSTQTLDCYYYGLDADDWYEQALRWLLRWPQAEVFFSASTERPTVFLRLPMGPSYELVHVAEHSRPAEILRTAPLSHHAVAYTGRSLIFLGKTGLVDILGRRTRVLQGAVLTCAVQQALDEGWMVQVRPTTQAVEDGATRPLLQALAHPSPAVPVSWIKIDPRLPMGSLAQYCRLAPKGRSPLPPFLWSYLCLCWTWELYRSQPSGLY